MKKLLIALMAVVMAAAAPLLTAADTSAAKKVSKSKAKIKSVAPPSVQAGVKKGPAAKPGTAPAPIRGTAREPQDQPPLTLDPRASGKR